MLMRIAVDFNTTMADEYERVYINTVMQNPHLLTLLESGKQVVLYDEEMEVKAVLEFDTQHRTWLGHPDWKTRRDIIE